MTTSNSHPVPPLGPIPEVPEAELRRRAKAWADNLADPENTWIFATGSLIWNPGFPFAERRKAAVRGWSRALCLYSITYRGTHGRPGLVMGLTAGGACEGCAYRIDPARLHEAAWALWDREMGHESYELISLEAKTDDGPVPAFSFAVRTGHPQCATGLPADTVEAVVRVATGLRGSNLDYVLNTIDHLDALGIRDPDLHALADRLRDCTEGEKR